MAAYTIFKLRNLSPLHIGTGKENYDFSASQWQSDAISAALVSVRAMQGKSDVIQGFLDSFVVSSAFPYVNDCLFLPKPQGKISVEVSGKEEHEYRKKLKKIKFIERSLWQELITGKTVKVSLDQIQGEYLLPANVKDFLKPMQSQLNQRVSVPRDNDEAQPFFFDWTYFRENAGLFFLVKAGDDIIEELKFLLEMLGETGIGTDKNVGGGKFEVEKSNIRMDIPENPNATLLLSTYIPTEEELPKLQLPDSKYELIRRDGYLAGSSETDFRHLRKKAVYMFNVGSVFKTTTAIQGKIVDLRPDWNDERMHPIYRSGKPFVVPVNLMENE